MTTADEAITEARQKLIQNGYEEDQFLKRASEVEHAEYLVLRQRISDALEEAVLDLVTDPTVGRRDLTDEEMDRLDVFIRACRPLGGYGTGRETIAEIEAMEFTPRPPLVVAAIEVLFDAAPEIEAEPRSRPPNPVLGSKSGDPTLRAS